MIIKILFILKMKYQDFSSDENLVSSEDMIFIFVTTQISLPSF